MERGFVTSPHRRKWLLSDRAFAEALQLPADDLLAEVEGGPGGSQPDQQGQLVAD